jgi:hypothetical protein
MSFIMFLVLMCFGIVVVVAIPGIAIAVLLKASGFLGGAGGQRGGNTVCPGSEKNVRLPYGPKRETASVPASIRCQVCGEYVGASPTGYMMRHCQAAMWPVLASAVSEYVGELVKDRIALKRKTSRVNGTSFGLAAGRLLCWGSTQGLTPG